MTPLETRLVNSYCDALEKLNNIGIDCGEVTELQVNTRAKRRWGQCKYNTQTGTFFISISSKLLEEDVPDSALYDTLVHEMLHTCEGCLNHGNEWKELADKVNAVYGFNIKRTTSAEEKGLTSEVYEPMPVKYLIKCPNCGHVYKRRKMCYPVKHPEECGCTHCGHWGLQRV